MVTPLRKPRKIVTVYDEGTPNQQYITTYSPTLTGKAFYWLWSKAKNWPGQAKYVRNPVQMEKIAETSKTSTWRYPKGWVPHQYSRKWGYLVEDWGPKITFITPNYAHRFFIDWYGGEHGRTLIREKNKR